MRKEISIENILVKMNNELSQKMDITTQFVGEVQNVVTNPRESLDFAT